MPKRDMKPADLCMQYSHLLEHCCNHRISLQIQSFLLKKNFMVPFCGCGSTASRLEPLQGGSLLFTTKFPEILGTHFIDLRRMKG